jgi:ribose transport system ATP-binding protein
MTLSGELRRSQQGGDVSPRRTVLLLSGVSKSFGPVRALIDVSVECRAGEVHAVVGENGSGKSTLFGVASGVLKPDKGVVEIGGRPLHTGHASEALDLGLAMAYQTYSLVPELSVAHNLLLSVRPEHRPRRFSDAVAWAGDELARLDMELDAGAVVADLPLAQRQLLEVVKALVNRPGVLLLDEPTTALGPGEVAQLHDLVLAQVSRGVGVMYVSHRLPEVLEIADRVTVLRDGQPQGTFDVAEADEDRIVSLMIGQPITLAFPDRGAAHSDAPPLLRAEGMRGERFGPVDLTVDAGEIVGLAGAEGNGQDRIIRALAGVEPAHDGRVHLDGQSYRWAGPAAALAQGIVLLSGERLRESLFPVLGVRVNATVQVLRRFSRLGWLRRRRETQAVSEVTERLKTRTPSVDHPVRFLSGGNQQKVVLSRPFLRPVRVLLAQEPTQGVDVGSRFDIYDGLRQQVAAGVGMVVQSSDPLELAGLCDRVVVVSRGRIVDELRDGDLSADRITAAIVRAQGPTEGQRVRPEPPEFSPATSRPASTMRRAGPALGLALLMVLIGAYTTVRSDAFLTEFNLNSLLLLAVPLALVAMGQLNALLIGDFDISVGATAGLVVVTASFLLVEPSWWWITLGLVALIGISLAVGLFNSVLTHLLSIPSIVATIATLSVLQGIALMLRPTPDGLIDSGFMSYATAGIGFVPYAFIGVVVLALVLDRWLYRTRDGLVTRAVGFDETAAHRVGVSAGTRTARAFVASALLAGIGGLFLAAQVGIGDARLGGSLTLPSLAAAVLGGAALSGGRGSFIGAVNGALFLTLILNVLPFLGWTNAWGDIARGAVTLLALLLFQRNEVWTHLARLRARGHPAPRPAEALTGRTDHR